MLTSIDFSCNGLPRVMASIKIRPVGDGTFVVYRDGTAVASGLTRDQAAAKLRAANTAYGFVNTVAEFAHHPALGRC